MLYHVINLMELNGYKILTRPYELNIAGIRKNSTDSQKFNDELYVFWRTIPMDENLKYNGWIFCRFSICTDPASYDYYDVTDKYWDGLLVQGQYINGFKRVPNVQGKHGDVLLQKPRLPIRVFYEPIEGVINAADLRNPKHFKPLPLGRLINVYYDICFQPCIEYNGVKWIERNASGCQVFESSEDFEVFMELCSQHQNLYGNDFTYSLFDLKEPDQSVKVRLEAYPMPDRASQCPPDHPANY